MNETQGMSSEQNGESATDTNTLSVSATQAASVIGSSVLPETENAVPAVDSVAAPEERRGSLPSQETNVAMTSPGEVSVGDVWINEETSFRVDVVTVAGGVGIRFRIGDDLESSKSSFARFVQRAKVLFRKKELLPSGEWFFGSEEEIHQYIVKNGYRLEKRKDEKKK